MIFTQLYVGPLVLPDHPAAIAAVNDKHRHTIWGQQVAQDAPVVLVVHLLKRNQRTDLGLNMVLIAFEKLWGDGAWSSARFFHMTAVSPAGRTGN